MSFKPHTETLLDDINESNETKLKPNQVTFSQPVIGGAGEYNTSVVLTGIKSKGVIGEATISYNRFNIPELFGQYGVTSLEVEVTSATDVHSIIPDISARYGFDIVPEDVANETLDFDPEGTAIFTLTSIPGSYFFTGAIDVLVKLQLEELDEVITETELPGFVIPTIEAQ